jgi:hypothetical protein
MIGGRFVEDVGVILENLFNQELPGQISIIGHVIPVFL